MGNRQTLAEKKEGRRSTSTTTRDTKQDRKYVTGELSKSFWAAPLTLLYPHYHTAIGPTIGDDYLATRTKSKNRHQHCVIPLDAAQWEMAQKRHFRKSHTEMRAQGLSYLVTCSYAENWLGNPVDAAIVFCMETPEFDKTLPVGK